MDICRLQRLLDKITAGEESILKYLPTHNVDTLFYLFLARAITANCDAYDIKHQQEAYIELEVYVPLLIGYMQAKRKNKTWLNIYEPIQCYGGPEEGGWWYWYLRPTSSMLVDKDAPLPVNTDEYSYELSDFPARDCYNLYGKYPGFALNGPHYE